jgi:F0F1-type ATP synthase membrane subunit c/vacuolar-type H+-ATPase subunit K
MKVSPILSVVILAVGIALLIWGFNAKHSFASGVSQVVNDAPSDKSIILLVAGGLVAAVGIIGLLRRG